MEQALVSKLLAAVADIGGVYSDSRECAAQVAAAENLTILAGILQRNQSTRVGNGTLLADGEAVALVSVDIDGRLHFEPPTDLDTFARAWSLRLSSGQEVHVFKFVTGEAGDDERWVVSQPNEFYNALLGAKELACD